MEPIQFRPVRLSVRTSDSSVILERRLLAQEIAKHLGRLCFF